MDEQLKKKITTTITTEIEKTKAEIKRFSELVKPISPDNAIGRLSRLEAISAKSVNESALRSAKLKLAQLQTAMTNIDEPEFGICFECGEDIPIGRILLMPAAKMCVTCTEEYE